MMRPSFACPDWEDKLRRGETPMPELPLDPVYAGVAVKLFNKLRIPKAEGLPTMGEAAGEWMRDIVRAAFGSIDPETGGRYVGEIFNLVPKKNGKTLNAAALGLVALQMNRKPGAAGYIVGPTQEVANTSFEMACLMIEMDEYLSKRFRIVEHKKEIIDLFPDEQTGRPLNAKLMIKSFDPKVVTGGIPDFAILDELHVMSGYSFASRVLGQIRGGMVTNPKSLLITITTQSEGQPTGVFRDVLTYARGVRDGKITSGVRMLPVIYEFPEAMQTADDKPWADPKNWPLVMPNLGRSLTIERMVDEWERERQTSDEAARQWASQHLNVEIGLAMHDRRWVGADYWLGAADRAISLEHIIEVCDVAVVGGDIGGLDDLFGLAVLGRHRDTRKWLAWCRAWAQPIALERNKDMAEALRGFAKDGDLAFCEVGEDVRAVLDIVLQLDRAGLLPDENAIGLDPALSADMVVALAEAGIGDPKVMSVNQGYRLSSAIFGAERLLAAGNLQHSGSPLMNWCVGNAVTELRGQNVYITKRKASEKIDPLMALFNAVEMASRAPAPRRKSIYESRGILTV